MSTIRFKKRIIAIQLTSGSMPVSAVCWRFAAVHKAYVVHGLTSASWCVTHIPTGLQLAGRIRTKALARRIAIAFVRHIPEFANATSDAQADTLPDKDLNRALRLRELASRL